MIRRITSLVAVAAAAMLSSGCNEESAANASGEGLSIILKSDQRVGQGEMDEVLVTVNRDDFDGPVDIKFTGLPTGITLLNPGPIPRGDASRTYELQASAAAPPVENHAVTVTARAKSLSVSETFDLTVHEE